MQRLFLLLLFLVGCGGAVPPLPTPTITPEPIVPTRTPLAETAVSPAPTVEAETAVIPTPQSVPQPQLLVGDAARFGVLSGEGEVAPAQQAGLPFGLLLDWDISATLPNDPSFTFWQMLRLGEEGVKTDWDEIAAIARAHPGSVWVVGNEPDVKWQDNVTAGRYAELYHEAYTFIKQIDPTAQLASGGISQSTPLRRAYLDEVLAAYEANYGGLMPVDVWTLHAFTLREERDSWGVDIPPGMSEDVGVLYEIEDHNDPAIFQQNIVDFRAWMAARGYRERPLAITEYGILLPSDYGFPDEVVIDFMQQSFDFLLGASNDTGLPSDDNRLVQAWFWYMVYDDQLYPTGNLYDPQAGELTAVGQAYADYVNGRFSR
ncbi:MAG: hypothetical protein H6668_04125 [Ardenticatenaceae bacterium]|nr:hypothetical protein [Ardenticatenaceae bacterium]